MTHFPIPMLPVLSTNGWRFPVRRHNVEEVFSGMSVLNLESGTAAITLALELSGVNSSSEVLIPSYNCKSMREPVWVHGAKDVLYAVREDLTVDLSDIESKLTARSKAILVPHFFGFMQPMEEIRRLCTRNNLVLIEDCAHALYKSAACRDIGTHGDFVVGSATKFYPVAEGGFLASPSCDLGAVCSLSSRSLKRDLKALVNCLELSFKYRRLPIFRYVFGALFWAANRWRTSSTTASVEAKPNNTRRLEYIDADNYKRPMTRTAGAITRCYSQKYSVQRRQLYYSLICEAIGRLSRCRVLFPKIESAIIPYMVPVLIADPEETFPVLKRSGMPMYRWEDCGQSDCPVSNRYARELIHLPCHEQLSRDEIDRMVGLLGKHLA